MAIFEMMLLTDRVKELIMKSASTEQLRHIARGAGDAGRCARRDSWASSTGHTTIEEVVRETLFTA
jgi:type II secretory ATPase GspE/PulE/Tfp pilus assembly ATPase PilB-like protein